MAEVTLEFLGSQMERLLGEFATMRREFASMRTTMSELAHGQTVLTQALSRVEHDQSVLTQTLLRVERDMVQIKDTLSPHRGAGK